MLFRSNTRPVPLTFEQARARVLADFKMTAQNKLEDADERYLRDKAEILVADDYADAYSKAEAAKDLKSMRDAAREAKATTGAK